MPESTFDPFDHGAMEDPYPLYAWMREHHPVYRNEPRDFWALSRYADVQTAARDWQTFSSTGGVNLDETHELSGAGNFIAADPAPHDVLRRLVREPFTPAGIRALGAQIEQVVATAVAGFCRAGGGDAAQLLAWRIPVETICRLLGIPVTEVPAIVALLHDVIARTSNEDELPRGAREGAEQIRARMRALAAGANPAGAPLGDAMRAALVRDELDLEAFAGMGLLLLVAGTETVADFIGNALHALAGNPDQRALLSADPDRVTAGVEELLRFESPVQHQVRTLTRPLELHGIELPAGAHVLLLWGAANRDERRWEHADRLDVAREPLRHLAFGEGIHHCLGAPLARLEGGLLLRELLAVAPRYELAGPVRFIDTHNTRGLAALPLAM
jgi:cytochrome P450